MSALKQMEDNEGREKRCVHVRQRQCKGEGGRGRLEVITNEARGAELNCGA